MQTVCNPVHVAYSTAEGLMSLQGFPDVGPTGILHPFENPALNESSCGTSTALNQQPGNIDLADHSKTVITYPHAFSPPQGDDRGGLACKVESPGDWDSLMDLNEAFSRSFDPLTSARSGIAVISFRQSNSHSVLHRSHHLDGESLPAGTKHAPPDRDKLPPWSLGRSASFGYFREKHY